MTSDSYVDEVMAKAQKKADRYFLMKKMAGEGRNYGEIGQAVGLSRERVRQILGNRDVVARKARILADNMNTICDMWVAGDSLREIAQAVDLPFHWISGLKFPRRVKPITHGWGGYKRGCRCSECKAANAKRARERLQRLRKDGLCIGCRAKSETWVCACCRARGKRVK